MKIKHTFNEKKEDIFSINHVTGLNKLKFNITKKSLFYLMNLHATH